MKSMRFTFLSLAIFGLTIMSCGKSSDDGCSDSEFEQKEAAFNEAGSVSLEAQFEYLNDKTQANCIAWRDAYLDYLNKYEAFIDCLPEISQGNWEIAYSNAVQARNEIPC